MQSRDWTALPHGELMGTLKAALTDVKDIASEVKRRKDEADDIQAMFAADASVEAAKPRRGPGAPTKEERAAKNARDQQLRDEGIQTFQEAAE